MIKYAGVYTLLPTPEVEEFISRLLNQADMRFWNDPGNGPDVGASAPVIPKFNWQRTFQPRLNQLIWPTGASRWASMLLLVTSEQLEEIKLLTDPSVSRVYGSAGQQLVIADTTFQGVIEDDTFTREVLVPAEGETPASYGKSIALSAEMYALEARPVSLPYQYQFNEGTEEWEWVETTEKTLWLLPIVDRRWFCQWFTIQDYTWDTWKVAVESCLDRVGPRGEVTPHTDYGDPPSSLSGQVNYGNAAELADALAHTIGQRITRRIDGIFRCSTATQAQIAWDNNLGSDENDPFEVWRRIAGGDYTDKHKAAATIPQNVRVVFTDGTSVVTPTEDAGAIQWAISSTFATLFPASDGSSGKDAFALQATTDYLGWLSKKADIVFAGVKAWRLTGFEDFVAWSVNTTTGITTRVVTHPETLGMMPVGGGGGGSCTRRYLVTVYYFPIGGSFVIQVRARDPATGDIVSQNKTISYNASASAVSTAIETHPHIDTGTVAVMGSGNFPNHSMTITLPGDAELSYVSNTFTRQSTNDPYPNVLITECCT